MLDFIRKSFKTLFEIILWINLISFTILGGLFGYFMASQYAGNTSIIVGVGIVSNVPIGIIIFFSIFGVLLGFLVGIFINIIIGGVFSFLINIDDNLVRMNKRLALFVPPANNTKKE